MMSHISSRLYVVAITSRKSSRRLADSFAYILYSSMSDIGESKFLLKKPESFSHDESPSMIWNTMSRRCRRRGLAQRVHDHWPHDVSRHCCTRHATWELFRCKSASLLLSVSISHDTSLYSLLLVG